MNKAEKIFDMIIMANQQPSEIAQPGKQALDFPPPPVTAQNPAVLRRRFPTVQLVRRNQLNSPAFHASVQRIRIVRFISNQQNRLGFQKSTSDNRLHEGSFVRGSARYATGDRKTRAVCHCHELRAFAPLGLSHAEPPFFADTNVPSIKHSDKSNPPRSFKSSARTLNTRFNTPDRTQLWNLRWQVWYGRNSFGKSCQAAPVRKTQKIPSKTSRFSFQGLPRPSDLRDRGGINGPIFSHCSSVTFRDNFHYLALYSAPVSRPFTMENHNIYAQKGFMR